MTATPAATAAFQARSYNDVGQHQRAVDVLSDALIADPHDAELLALMAWSLMPLGRLDEAEAAGQAALGADPDMADADIALIRVSHLRGQHHEVFRRANEHVLRWPQSAAAHIWVALSRCRLAVNDADRAVSRAARDTALELGGRTAGLLLNAAWIEAQFGDRAACLAFADEGLESAPNDADLLKLRAWAVGDVGYRSRIMMGILAVDPLDTEAQHTLMSDVTERRASLMLAVAALPLVGTLLVLLPPPWPRALALVVLVALLARAASRPLRYLLGLPEALRSRGLDTDVRLVLVSAALSLVGLTLFALDLRVGPPLVVAGVVVTAVAKLRVIRRDLREDPVRSPGWLRRREQQSLIAGGVVAMCIMALLPSLAIGWSHLDVDAGAIAAPLILFSGLCLVIGLRSLLVLITGQISRRRFVRLAVSLTLTAVAALFVPTVVTGVAQATSDDMSGRYARLDVEPRQCAVRYRSVCVPEYDPPTFTPPSVSPIPELTFEPPEIDLPDIDVPTPPSP